MPRETPGGPVVIVDDDAKASALGRVRLFVIAATRLYREGLAEILGRVARVEVVGTAAEVEVGVAAVRELRPDIVLLDTATPRSFLAVQAILTTTPGTHVVALAVLEVDGDIIALAEAGVSGFVTREGSLDDLVATIESVALGETLCSPRMAAALLRRVRALAAEQRLGSAQAHLTSREFQIIGLIDHGLSNKEIAGQLSIELATVKNHVHNILEKLQVHRRSEAAARVRTWSAADGSGLSY